MAKCTGIVMPDEDYVQMNTAELEYSGGSQQAKAEAQAAGVTQDDSSSSFKEVALGLAPSIGQLAMMYFMFGGRSAAPVQKGPVNSSPSVVRKAAPKNNVMKSKSDDVPFITDDGIDLDGTFVKFID